MHHAQRVIVIQHDRHLVDQRPARPGADAVLADIPRRDAAADMAEDAKSGVKRRPFVEIGLIAAMAVLGIELAFFEALPAPARQARPRLLTRTKRDEPDIED